MKVNDQHHAPAACPRY